MAPFCFAEDRKVQISAKPTLGVWGRAPKDLPFHQKGCKCEVRSSYREDTGFPLIPGHMTRSGVIATGARGFGD
jgi:hypothetical protein